MSAFNSSGRKEDFSMKLRAQRQGGGFWQRGQTGTLNSYATEVLQEKSNKSSKKKGVKVLKDEPLDLPSRNTGPGTIKYIAQRSPRVDLGKDKNKGPKCGQCEDRSASLNCVQCSENYCAGCFAAFHLKGALKRHRTIPLHATGPRQCMSPRPTPPASSRSNVSGGATSGDVFYQQADRYGPGGASGSGDGGDQLLGNSSLLEGAYNEADSAASFQEALMAWRQGESAPDAEPTKPKPKPKKAVVVSPVRSPVMMVEHSTSTTTDSDNHKQAVADLKFSPHSLSYAQRLMLKQHRRTDIGHLGTPRLGSADTSVTGSSGLTSVTPRLSSVGRGEGHGSDDDDLDGDDERVDFQSLYNAITTSEEQGSSRTTVSNVSVVDVTNSPKDQRSASAESSTYTVQEVSGQEAFEAEREARLAEQPNPKQLSKSRETTRVIEKRTRVPKSREVTRILDKASVTDVQERDLDEKESDQLSTGELAQVQPSRLSLGELATVEERATPVSRKKPPPATTTPRPKSVKARPASARSQASKSRPASRAQSRAASRMGEEGILTKAPTTSLSEIARRGPDSSVRYQSPMEGFFLAGVKVEDQVAGSKSRPGTPSQVEKLKVSNKLYAMSPKSWRPDSSLGDAVPADSVGTEPTPPSGPTMLHYMYSEQLEGKPLAWNPQDSFGTPVPPEEAPTPTPPQGGRSVTPSRQRRRWGTPDPSSRPFSAQQRENSDVEAGNGEGQQTQARPSSSTGGLEPSKKQRRKLPSIDHDLDADKRAMARRQKSNNDGWIPDEEQQDPVIRALSASRTRSWVASQNSLRPDSSRWETEVQEFVEDSSDLDGVTPRPHSRSQPPRSARSATTRSSMVEDSGRTSRAIVMDGDDLSKYDADAKSERVQQNSEDKEALEKLEWELASESGRLTADGKVSRLSAMEMEDDVRSSGSRSSSSTVRLSYDQGYDINTKLREDELSEGENEERVRSAMDLMDEEDVRALR